MTKPDTLWQLMFALIFIIFMQTVLVIYRKIILVPFLVIEETLIVSALTQWIFAIKDWWNWQVYFGDKNDI